jgi:hypothetical protein
MQSISLRLSRLILKSFTTTFSASHNLKPCKLLIQSLNTRDQKVIDVVWQDKHSVPEREMDELFTLLRRIEARSMSEMQLLQVIFFLAKSSNRKIAITRSTKLAAIFISSHLDLISTKKLDDDGIYNIIRVVCTISNLNIRCNKYIEVLFMPETINRVIDCFDNEKFKLLVPNLINAIAKLKYFISNQHAFVLPVIIEKAIQSGETKMFVQKRLNFLWTIFMYDFVINLQKETIKAGVSSFFTQFRKRDNLNLNTKFANQFVEIFCLIFPLSSEYILKYGYVPSELDFKSEFYNGDFADISSLMSKCLKFLGFNNRSFIEFHPIYIEHGSRNILIQKKVKYGNPLLYEKDVCKYLKQMGYSDVFPNFLIGIYEIDLLVDKSIMVNLNGKKHSVWEFIYKKAHDEWKLIQTTPETTSHNKKRSEILETLGIKHVIDLPVTPKFREDKNDFAKALAEQIHSKLVEIRKSPPS